MGQQPDHRGDRRLRQPAVMQRLDWPLLVRLVPLLAEGRPARALTGPAIHRFRGSGASWICGHDGGVVGTQTVSDADTGPVSITVDAAAGRGPFRPIHRFFGADEPNYAYLPDGLALLREIGQFGPAQAYFRTHNLMVTGDGASWCTSGSRTASSGTAGPRWSGGTGRCGTRPTRRTRTGAAHRRSFANCTTMRSTGCGGRCRPHGWAARTPRGRVAGQAVKIATRLPRQSVSLMLLTWER